MRLHASFRRERSSARNGRREAVRGTQRAAFALTLALLIVIACVTPYAAGAVAPGAGRPALMLGFGDPYGDEPRMHSGVDVDLRSNSAARSAVAGVVTFAGLVPATGGDYRVGAVSVRNADGHLVTLSPLNDLAVAKGDLVPIGHPLGVVASAGDGSTQEIHLHLSERVGGRYVDPTHLLDAWFATYVSGEAGGSGGGAGGTEKSRPANRTPARVQAKPATVSAAPRATTETLPGALGAVAGEMVTPGAANVSLPTFGPSLALVLHRELVSHPDLTLGLSSVAAQPEAAASAVTNGHSGQQLTDTPQAGAHVRALVIDSIRYLGAGLVTLAAGLGFALLVVGGPEKNGALHRLGSLFAVRGERW